MHATLALAAATALAARERTDDWDPAGMDPADRLAWDYAASAAAPVAAERDAWGAKAPSMPYADWLAEGRAPQPAQDAAASASRTRQGGPAT